MKKIILSCCVWCCFAGVGQAQTFDILSDDLAIDYTANKSETVENTSVSAENATVEENGEKGSLFSFITKPLSLLFSADDEIVVDAVSGKTETFLEKSIRQAMEGNLEDQMNLGYMYLYGTNGVTQNFDEALKFYTMAAMQNDPIALNNLGSLYFNGIGGPANPKKAVELFAKAAELGNDNAATNLAFIYLKGGVNDSVRNQKAVNLLKSASEKGNNTAKFMLGYAYYKGFAVEQNYDEAFKLIRSAALPEGNLDEAQLVLAEMYINGIGTVQNYVNGIKMYRMAVSQGNSEAYMKLAEIYKNGIITPQNLIMAHALYNVASVINETAAIERDKIGQTLPLEQLLQAQASAQNFKAAPSELTNYIRQTFGDNIRSYIDINMGK